MLCRTMILTGSSIFPPAAREANEIKALIVEHNKDTTEAEKYFFSLDDVEVEVADVDAQNEDAGVNDATAGDGTGAVSNEGVSLSLTRLHEVRIQM